MNSILTLIITYFFKPCFGNLCRDLRDQINESQILAADPPQISSSISASYWPYCSFLLNRRSLNGYSGFCYILFIFFITVEDTALNRFLLLCSHMAAFFLLQCILLGIMYFIFRIEAFNGTGISFLGNFLTFVSAAAFFQLPFAKHLF